MTVPGAPQERFEFKYLIPLSQEEQMAAWLEHSCALDLEHPVDTISSVYFDTPRLALYEGKASSDYVKVKVRLRWYGVGVAGESSAFLESKIKEGRSVRKVRERLTLPREALENLPVAEGLVEALQARAETLTGTPLGLLRPVCLVRYRRRRYVDVRTGSRVALDGEIRAFPANGFPFPAIAPVMLGVVVLEVKGACVAGGHFPHLFPGNTFATLPSSFSKYGAGVEALITGGLCGPAVPWAGELRSRRRGGDLPPPVGENQKV